MTSPRAALQLIVFGQRSRTDLTGVLQEPSGSSPNRTVPRSRLTRLSPSAAVIWRRSWGCSRDTAMAAERDPWQCVDGFVRRPGRGDQPA